MLYIVPTPIGHLKDFTLRAIEVLRSVEVVIVEEKRIGERYLKYADAHPKTIVELNEHTTPSEIAHLVTLCRSQPVALISDAGTPNFCDPGAQLIQALRKEQIPMTALPGPSCLTTLLSLAGQKLEQFYFRGFLPQETAQRQQAWKALTQLTDPFIIMDTPYRLTKTLTEAQQFFPSHRMLLGVNLSTEDEFIREDTPERLLASLPYPKGNFILLVYPSKKPQLG